MSRKDSKSMFANVLGQLGNDISQPTGHSKSSSPHLLKVAAGVRHIQERSDLADRLLKDAEHIVELDPATIEPSSIVDRYDPAYEEIAIGEIAQSMRERGQIVPGLVRPIPGKAGRFQIVYGRRRLAAANQLGIKFKAAIRELTDEHLACHAPRTERCDGDGRECQCDVVERDQLDDLRVLTVL